MNPTKPSKFSILLISNLFSVGAAYGAVCKELAARLIDAGWRVTTTSSLPNRLLRPVGMLVTVWRARRQYMMAQIDVFSGPAFRWAELTTRFLQMLGKPYVLTLHGGNLPTFGDQHPRRVQRLLNNAACITTPSHYLLEKMRVFHPDIRLIPNPIDVSRYPFRLRSTPMPRIIYLRALHKIYNPILAVYSVQLLLDEYPEIYLKVVGPNKGDGTREKLVGAIAEMNLNTHVAIVGAVPKADIPSVLNSSDIFVNTTNVDNTPISVIEAMASGLCIVSTNVGGVPYLLTHEQDALLVPPNDPEAMAEAIRRILTDPGLAERLSRNARAKAEQFDWSVVLPQWEALLANVIERHNNG